VSSMMQKQGSLALATSLIHRSRSLDDLRRTFFTIAPRHIDGCAFGMYLFDDKLNTTAIFSHRASHKFLNEYEKLRNNDPLFIRLLKKKRFTHSLGVFDTQEWLRQPLHLFLSRWGLDYSIEAPLIVDGQVKGTLNIARSGSKYFERGSLDSARFLCKEIDAAFNHIHEIKTLKEELSQNQTSPQKMTDISGRARQVLELTITGLSNSAIASRLAISENTVRHHLKRIYQVLDVHNRVQLVQRVFSTCSISKPN